MGNINFNGISSKDLGVEVETFPDYVAPQKEFEAVHVPGRNGDVLIDTGAYQNVSRPYKINAYAPADPVQTKSGSVVSFNSSAAIPLKNLEAEIVPKQDLHGYDSPWIDSNVINKTPYLSRSISGTASRIGNYEYNKLVGGTVAFNQLIKNGDFSNNLTNWDVGGNTNANVSNNICYLTAKSSPAGNQYLMTYSYLAIPKDHKILISAFLRSDTDNECRFQLIQQNPWASLNVVTISGINSTRKMHSIIISVSDGTASNFNFNVDNKQSLEISNVNLIDLTQMLGASIADYIYSLEQANTGAGVAYFRALFSADYYPYNAGELMSVKATAHVTKNAGGAVIQTVALDPNLELRGIVKLDANNKLYYDGDTYESNGNVNRRFSAHQILSTDIVAEYLDTENNQFLAKYEPNDAPKQTGSASVKGNAFSPTLTLKDQGEIYRDTGNNIAVMSDSNRFRLSFAGCTTFAQMQTYLDNNPTYVVYERATATSEQAQAFNNPIAIDANGSEEFTDSRAVAIPVGHESYYANICPIVGHSELNIGNTQIEEIRELFTIDPSFIGRVNFNQLINDNLLFGGAYNASKSYDSITGVMTVTPVNYSNTGGLYQVEVYQKDHIYLSIGDINPDNGGRFLFGIEGSRQTDQIIEGGIYTRIYNLAKAITTPQSMIAYYYPGGSPSIVWSSGSYKIKNVNVFDLTVLFGETIADYIYNLEQSQAGAGVEFFKAIYPQDYYPYNVGQDKLVGDITPVTVAFGQTVYGGAYDAKTRRLTITFEIHTFDGSEYWNNCPADWPTYGHCFTTAFSGSSVTLCDRYDKDKNAWNTDNGVIIPWSGTIAFSDSRFSSPSDFRTEVANNNIHVVYPLAVPIVIDVQAISVFAERGLNTIFSDAEEIEVTFGGESFSYIMSKISEWLLSPSGYSRLEDTYDKDVYRMAYYGGNPNIANIFNEAGQADIEFICKPQRFLKSGEKSIVFNSNGTINNFTNHPALPLLKIVSNNTLESGSDIVGTIYIGNHALSIKNDETIPAGTNITIIADCELQNAYSEVLGEEINRNNLIVLNGEDMPRIEPGIQQITFDGGIQSVEVIPRWWTV